MDSTAIPYIKQDEIHFGFDLPVETNRHLQRAASLVSSREGVLQALSAAQASAPDQLEVLIARYKFHFYQGDTDKAQDLVSQTLIKSALQGGFSHEWESLLPKSADWSDPRGPERVFLYSLKALAFIRLRQEDFADAASILDAVKRLDPEDQVGADVIRDLLRGLQEES
ncbi:MAG: hypothetical protein JAZ02_06200 [Candidatus Thiodiazotropha endolucinida]|nr:hypothetical protein [Candidatus Thiodiazotropha endolucinida]